MSGASDGQAPVENAARDALKAIWARHHEAVLDQISVLERAVSALIGGNLGEDQRAEAEREAHKLSGSLGTFGFAGASERARELEKLLATPPGAHRADHVAVMAQLALGLREQVQAEPVVRPPSADPPVSRNDSSPLLVIVEDDHALADSLASEADRRGISVLIAASPAECRSLADRHEVHAVLLDLIFDGETSDAYELLSELSARTPPVPVLAFTARDTFTDRIEVVRRGGRGFVHKSMPPQQAIDQVAQLIERVGASDTTLLAVDDDPAVLSAIGALLEPEGIRVRTLSDPRRFWDELEKARPDIVMLDVDMPDVSGIELCRVLRNDVRWSAVPVLFLTSRRDEETVQAMFAAGADDYLLKPVIPQELVVRIRNRRDRFELYRALAERDTLTGVSNRRASTQALDRLLRLARRFDQPLALAALDLDHFKSVNDRFGHGTGDAVLRRLGERLLHEFRGEDVVGRWGGEEFIVGLYGMTRDDAVQRILDVLRAVTGDEFHAPGGETFHVTFSAGVAEHRLDGDDVMALYRSADRALYEAKAAGRNRVMPAGAPTVKPAAAPDVVIVEDDDVLGELLVHTMATHGHVTRWIDDGAAAVAALCGTDPELRPRVILLDVDLPAVSGSVILRRLRDDGALAHTNIIMLTARSSEEELLATLDLGAFDHVAKPFSLPVLMHKIDRAMAAATP